MKFKHAMIIDADVGTVWKTLDAFGEMPRWMTTDKRKPTFIAGIYRSGLGKAVVVNHLEAIGDRKARWVVYANHRLRAGPRMVGVFLRHSISTQTRELMERVKQSIETGKTDTQQ